MAINTMFQRPNIAGTAPTMDPRGIVPVNRTQPQPTGVQRIPEQQGLGSLPTREMVVNGVVPVARPGSALPANFRGQPVDPSFEGLQRAALAQELGPRARAANAVVQAAANNKLNRQQLMERMARRPVGTGQTGGHIGGLLKGY
jgi:hypothetical protein